MNTKRRLARDYLNDSSLTDFWTIVAEAKISDADKLVLDAKFVRGKSYVQIADEQNISPETVKKIITKAYEKIARLI